jgi:hypothetical protein
MKLQGDLRLREAGIACTAEGSGHASFDEAATLDHGKTPKEQWMR